MSSIVLKSFLPEVFFSLSILLQLVFNASLFAGNKNYNYPLVDKELFYQVGFFLICILLLQWNSNIEGCFNNFLFLNDSATKQIKLSLLLSCFFCLPIINLSFQDQKINFFEFFSLFLLSILSLMLMISSCDLLTFYLTLEMQSLCFYVLACFKRNSSFSTDSGLKYFISGSFISGFFLFGCSLIYAVLGTLNLNSIFLLLSFPSISHDLYIILFIGIVFVTSIILFKVTCAPLHFWAPDVYEGAPLSSTIIFSIVPKLPLFFFFAKWLSTLGVVHNGLFQIILFSGIFSLLLGTIFGLVQKRLKRLIIYSSIAQVGFLVCSVSFGDIEGYVSMYFFIVIYLITSILIWGYFVILYTFQNNINTFFAHPQAPLFLASLSGLSKYNTVLSFSFLVVFFSIAGIPPLAGFLSKVLVISVLIKNNFIISGVLLMIISSLSVFYYIRIIKLLYFEPNKIVNVLENYQINYQNIYFDKIYLIFSFLTFLLITLFFEPNFLVLICEYIVLSSMSV